ncbi:hypothetical protein CONLIGDRAFT_632110, partial [Coniochaeta ligniaria NRRL 30616]
MPSCRLYAVNPDLCGRHWIVCLVMPVILQMLGHDLAILPCGDSFKTWPFPYISRSATEYYRMGTPDYPDLPRGGVQHSSSSLIVGLYIVILVIEYHTH